MSLPASGFKGASPGQEPRATTPGSACPARRALVLSLRLTGPPPPDATPSLRPGPQAAPPVGPGLRLAQTSSRWRCCDVDPTKNRISATDASPAWQRHSLRRERWSCFTSTFLRSSKSFWGPDKSARCQLPGRRSREPHAFCSPAVSRSTRLRRRIPGSLGRYLAAPRPPLSRRGAAVLRLPPLTRTHLASRISLPSPTRPPLEGTLRGEAVRSRRVGRSHSGCGSSSSSSSGPPHPAPAP